MYTKSKDELYLITYYQQIADSTTDLEVFALVVEHAAERSAGNVDQFVCDLNYLIMNARSKRLALLVGLFERTRYVLHYRHSWIPPSRATERFGSSGFAADDKSNQVQHFWYFAALSYTWSSRLAEALAQYHEWNPTGVLRHLPLTGGGHGTQEDLILSEQGIELGQLLKTNRITPDAVGPWLRQNLGA